MKKIIRDTLTVKSPEKDGGRNYSLSRIVLTCYVFISFFTLILPFVTNIDISIYNTMSNLVITILFLFAGYAFGGKVVASISETRQKIEKIKQNGYETSEYSEDSEVKG